MILDKKQRHKNTKKPPPHPKKKLKNKKGKIHPQPRVVICKREQGNLPELFVCTNYANLNVFAGDLSLKPRQDTRIISKLN